MLSRFTGFHWGLVGFRNVLQSLEPVFSAQGSESSLYPLAEPGPQRRACRPEQTKGLGHLLSLGMMGFGLKALSGWGSICIDNMYNRIGYNRIQYIYICLFMLVLFGSGQQPVFGPAGHVKS